jgi:AcrR family transcriptional regulator
MATSETDAPVVENGQTRRSNLSTLRLLEASAALIAERGYERTTLVEIGKRAGYSHGLVTRRFGNKANLLNALIDRMTARYGTHRLMNSTGELVGVEAVQKILRTIQHEAEHSPSGLRGFWALMFEALKPVPELRAHIADINEELRAGVAELMIAGLKAGQVRPGTDPHAAANLIASAMRGSAYFWMLDPERYDIVSELGNLSEQIEAAYRNR